MMVCKMFFYQPTFTLSELKVDKGTEYVISWKSKDLNRIKVLSLHGAFFTKHKIFCAQNSNTIQ